MARNLLLLICLAPLLVGCGSLGLTGGTDSTLATNQLIAAANQNNRVAYGNSLAACGTNAACQVGVSAAYFSNAGQQQFFKPITPLDYIRELVPYALIGERIIDRAYGGVSGNNDGGLTVAGDHNVVMDVGNTKTADNQSTVSDSNTGTSENLIDMLNRKYNLGADTTGGGTITDDGVVVEPPIDAGVAPVDVAVPTE